MPELSCTVITTAAAFHDLRQGWNSLLERADHASVFLSWEWQYNWWTVYGKHHRLHLILVWNNSRIVGILPTYLQIEQYSGVFSIKILRFVGTGGDTNPDDLGPLIEPELMYQVSDTLAHQVISKKNLWDVLQLTDIPHNSEFISSLSKRAKEHNINLQHNTSAVIRFAELPNSYETFLSRFSSSRRWRMGRNRRKIETQFSTRFIVWTDHSDLDTVIDRLIHLHCSRWDAAGMEHSFASEEYKRFHRMVIKACHACNWIRLYCLELNGNLVAIVYCYHFRDTIFLMQSGFDPNLSALSPGSVLLGYAIEHMIAEGKRVFDFLRGEHRYKDELATSSRVTVEIRSWRWNLAGRIAHLRHCLLPTLRKRAGKAVKTLRLRQ